MGRFDVNALKQEILLSQPREEEGAVRMNIFLNEIKGCTDEEFARLERIIRERRGRTAAHAVVAPIGTAQPSNPRSRAVQKHLSIYVFVWRKTPRAR